MTIKIDSIELSTPVILAPMSGVTDLPFRKLVKQFGAGLVVSEMIASRAMIQETRKSIMKSALIENDITGSCVQLAGCEPDVMADAARMNQDMGAKIIDINFGCPAKKIVGGYAGSALMRNELLAAKILAATVESVSIPVTLKMRTGWDESCRNAHVIAKIAEDCGIKMITVHGRTRCQFYSGKSDWEFIKKVKESIKIPVIANGDITSVDDAINCLKISKADGVMVGRGAYGKPWLLSQISYYLTHQSYLPPPSLIEQKQVILNHYESMLSYYGIEHGMRIARKHLGWYSKGLHNSTDFRSKVTTMENTEQVREIINQFFSE
ncbi:TIM-barrel, nifR3 family protein [Orientia chuto str. Dubai]|uniref:tRNA-dihydrouridine synthase n=1 Tax=Orientia chuto str. Dubai TaxID=1359168 RepID=A0A0F3MK39_9RICK|nr:tRNA dihydrouridine synthase DusB [Candidatus Orientia mediorientalis]KJV56026.1 TIM-barrel, nifR3 family protein [Orientia chuto str. Dubai]